MIPTSHCGNKIIVFKAQVTAEWLRMVVGGPFQGNWYVHMKICWLKILILVQVIKEFYTQITSKIKSDVPILFPK
jgi:hypothetical protein